MTTSIIVCEEEGRPGAWCWYANEERSDDDIQFDFRDAVSAVIDAMQSNGLVGSPEKALEILSAGTEVSSGEIVVTLPDRPPFKTYAQRILYQIDPVVNPVGAECVMRLQYGTLDHLHHGTFVAEAAIAKSLEKKKPGFLRKLADSYGWGRAFDEAERIIAIPGVVDQKMVERDHG